MVLSPSAKGWRPADAVVVLRAGGTVSAPPVPFRCEVRAKEEHPSRSGASDQGSETPGPGPTIADTVSGGAPCAATIQGCRGALAAPVARCTEGGRGCLSH